MANLSNINNKFLVTTGGNVGIGTTSPGEKLDVSGGHIKITNTGNTNLYINANNSGSDSTIFFQETGSVKAKIQHDASNDSMLFTDGAYTDTMTLKGGNVGIGTDSPDSYNLGSTGKTLAINSTSASVGSLLNMETAGANRGYLFANASNVVLSAVHTGIPLKFNTEDTTRLTIDSSGQVLIDIAGTSGSDFSGGGLAYRNNSGSYLQLSSGVHTDAAFMYFYRKNAGGTGVESTGTISNNGLGLVLNGSGQSNQLVLDSSGNATFAKNVGVGGVLPSSNGGSGATLLGVHDGVGSGWSVTKYTNTTTGTAAADGSIFGIIGSDAYIFNYEAGNLFLATNSTTALTIDSSQNVGIGTTDPDHKLEVVGGLALRNSNSRLYFGTNNGPDRRALEGDVNGTLLQVGEGYSKTALYGNVGIGTTNPGAKLTISGGDIYQLGSSGGYSQTKILPKTTPNYPSAGSSGTPQNWYQPVRGESGIIYYGNVNNAGGEYRCAGFVVFSAAESNNTPVAITIAATESVGAHMLAFSTASGWIQIQNTYGYAIIVMGRVESFLP